VHKKTVLLLLSFAILFDFSGCASMSAQARRERAYRHYVQKQMKARQKAIARAQKQANREMKRKMKTVQVSEPKITTTVEDVSAPSFSEPVAAPITVSASDSIAPESPDQPSSP
jgi:hypothetical protein